VTEMENGMRSFEIYFADLTTVAQDRLLDAFQTTEQDENWDICPLAVIEREESEAEGC